MKGISKKLLAVLLAAICAFSVFAVNASAWFDNEEIFPEDFFYDSVVEDNICYDIYTDEETSYATVFDFERDEEGTPLVDATVTIPETVEYNGTEVTVTEIGFMAFAECYTLREITLPDTITAIYDYAFASAPYLEKAVIPSTIEFEYFGSAVFDSTPVLGYFAENSTDGAVILGQNVLFAYLGNDETYTIPEGIDFLADYCFFMSGVENVIFNESISLIPAYAFASCRNLKEITIPDSVLDIAEGAFSNCTNLDTINLGDELNYIGPKAFENTKVKSIYIGANITDVASAFAGCNTLEAITVSEENAFYTFENNALYYTLSNEEFEYENKMLEYFLITANVTSFTVPEDVNVIGPYAFYNCKQLDKVIFNSEIELLDSAFAGCDFETFDFSKVLFIGYAAFRGCNELTSADLSNVDYVEDSAFENCTKLSSVTFGDAVYYVGARAFANTAITDIAIGGGDCEIAESAFADCKKLKTVEFNDGVGYINANVFTNCPELETVFVSKTVYYIDEYAFQDCQDVTFEIIKYSYSADTIIEYAEDTENDVTKYEFVGELTFFERVAKFFSDLFASIVEFFFGWLV